MPVNLLVKSVNYRPASLHVWRWLAAALIVLLVATPAAHLSAHTGTDHVAEDASMAVLAQGYAPFEVDPATIFVPPQADFDVFGSWSPVINWPHIPVSAANLPDGRVLTWASNQPDAFPGGTEYTYATVWDPASNSFTDVPHPDHDMFCAHQVVLEDGRVFVTGGRNHVPTTSVFDAATNTWTELESMNNGRWYPTTIALSDGGVLTAIGSSGGRYPEVWHPGLGWQLLTGIDLQAPILDFTSHYEQNWWPYLSVAPQGDVVHYGPTPNMHRLDVAGTGTITPAGVVTNSWYPKHGASVLYDEGKILLAGGASSGSNQSSTNQALIIDINSTTPIVTPAAPMIHARKFSNAIVLPDGEVLMVGGNTSGTKFSDAGSVLAAEIWNPQTQTWRVTGDMSVPRNYHSVALLLADGRVLSGGGGLCGNCSANHQDAQVYSPPYLFNADGTLATRPAITAAPAVIGNGEIFNVSATAGLQRFTMIKLSSTTHAVNTDQRFVEVAFSEPAAGQYQLISHTNVNVLTPGYYYLFGLDAQGVPAIAEIIQVAAGAAPANYPPAIDQLPTQVSVTGEPVSVFVTGHDIDGDPLNFSATGLPNGLSINSATGEISGTPGTVESTTVSVVLSAGTDSLPPMTFNWDITPAGNGMGSILQEWWVNISGPTIPELTGIPGFPGTPDGSSLLQLFEIPVNWQDDYGTRVHGYIHPPVTGDYTFWISSDDNGELWLSSDTSPANKALIANVPDWTSPRLWNKYPEQQSQPITLQAGQAYYIEALMKEALGGDNLAVAWQIPGQPEISVIGGAHLTPFGYDPANQTPVVTNPGMQVNVIGTAVNLQVVATDPDFDTLTYTATGLPNGLAINSSSGMISGTPTTTGTFNVTVTADDGGGRSDSAAFSWQVTLPVNNPPALDPVGNQNGIVGDSVNLTITASDPDAGDTLFYSATGLPAGLGIDSAMGIITGTLATAGTHYVDITVDDGNGGSDATSIVWTVSNPPLVVDPVVAAPVEVNTLAGYTASSQGGASPQYKWNFGDGSPETAFSPAPTASHTYTAPGRYIATLTVDDGIDTVIVTFIQDVYLPLTSGTPGVSMSIAYEERTGNDHIWNVNPDNDSVSVFDVVTGNKLAETVVGASPRSLAFAPDGRAWVVSKRAGNISIINADTFLVENTIALPAASQPHAVVFDRAGGVYAWVSLEATGQVLRLAAADGSPAGSISVAPGIRHLSISADGGKLLASRFVTPPVPGEHTAAPQIASTSPEGGEVFVIDTSTLTVANTVILHHSDVTDAENAGRGIPNYLGPAVISPDGSSAWVPSKQDNIKRGSLRDGMPLTHDSAVRSITSRIALATETEVLADRVDHDDGGIASTAVFSNNGNYLYVALEGSRQVSMRNAHTGDEVVRISTGRAPQGLALSPDNTKLYVHNFMDRTISVHDLGTVLATTSTSVPVTDTYNTVASEALAGNVLVGKQHFYDAGDARLALQNYISCASCHNDGGSDGRTWDFTGFGEGLRNTIDLRGHAGMGHGPLHWSANFDEVQDFEGQIRNFAFGLGLMDDADFHAGTRAQPLGDSKAGISADLDALAAYVTSLGEYPASPHLDAGGGMTADALSGSAVFMAANCIACHSGTEFTDSAPGNLHDIGTLTTASGNRLGGPLTGIDTPGLRGAWDSAPYLHDGSAATITAAINAHGGPALDAQQLAYLEAYLLQLDGTSPAPVDTDGDFLPDSLETLLGTDPMLADTDGDSLSDYDEVNRDGNPGDFTAFTDTDPTLADSDADSFNDNVDPFPSAFNYADGDLAPLGMPDGLLNAADLLIAYRILTGAISATELELLHGDIYPAGAPDGIINMSDVILLQSLVLGSPP